MVADPTHRLAAEHPAVERLATDDPARRMWVGDHHRPLTTDDSGQLGQRCSRIAEVTQRQRHDRDVEFVVIERQSIERSPVRIGSRGPSLPRRAASRSIDRCRRIPRPAKRGMPHDARCRTRASKAVVPGPARRRSTGERPVPPPRSTGSVRRMSPPTRHTPRGVLAPAGRSRGSTGTDRSSRAPLSARSRAPR